MQDSREQLLANLLRHGATQVDLDYLFKESVVTWRIGPEDEVSEACIRSELFMSNAARNAQSALRVIDRMSDSDNAEDGDLHAALRKYVEDTGESIKVVDNTLRDNGTNLETLFIEVPRQASDDEMSWRSLIGRREVIAHKLLTVDNSRVHREAVRDFGLLHQLLSKIHFNPVKVDLTSGHPFGSMFRADVIRSLTPSKANETPGIGQCIIFVFEDKQRGFLSLRFGRGENNHVLIAASQPLPSLNLQMYAMKRGDIKQSTPDMPSR